MWGSLSAGCGKKRFGVWCWGSLIAHGWCLFTNHSWISAASLWSATRKRTPRLLTNTVSSSVGKIIRGGLQMRRLFFFFFFKLYRAIACIHLVKCLCCSLLGLTPAERTHLQELFCSSKEMWLEYIKGIIWYFLKWGLYKVLSIVSMSGTGDFS